MDVSQETGISKVVSIGLVIDQDLIIVDYNAFFHCIALWRGIKLELGAASFSQYQQSMPKSMCHCIMVIVLLIILGLLSRVGGCRHGFIPIIM